MSEYYISVFPDACPINPPIYVSSVYGSDIIFIFLVYTFSKNVVLETENINPQNISYYSTYSSSNVIFSKIISFI